ncbi:hypothetical protein MKW94_020583, partial [Papaver nudicaule]|nr:hypothetical protein [Papaver nudicaule]
LGDAAPKVEPPILMRKAGRPRVNRRRAYDEPPNEKKARSCSKYKKTGHNSRNCAGGEVGSNPKRRRARTEVDAVNFTTTNLAAGQATGTRKRGRPSKTTSFASSSHFTSSTTADVGASTSQFTASTSGA